MFGQYPRDPAMAHVMESLMMEHFVIFNTYGPAHLGKDDAKIKEVIEGIASTFIAKLEPMLAKMKFIMGDKLTVIDFWVGSMYCDRCANPNQENAKTQACWDNLLKKYPNFKRWGEDFKKENADWLMKRPKYPI